METEGTETTGGQNPIEGEAPVTPPPQTPTAEEQVKALQAQLNAVQQERKQQEESYKGLQRKVNQTTEELKRQSDLKADLDNVKDSIKILAAAYAEKQSIPDEIENIPADKKQGLLKSFEELEKKQQAKRQLEAAAAKGEEYRQKVESLGLTNKDKAYFQIRNAVRDGDFEYADHLIAEVGKEKTVVEPTKDVKKETDEEIYLRVAKSKGLLKTETVVPSGGNRTIDQVRKDYVAGKITDSKYEEECRNLGVRPA